MYDGKLADYALLGTYNGSSSLPARMTSTSREMYVRFLSNKNVPCAGFNATYTEQCRVVYKSESLQTLHTFSSVDSDNDGLYDPNLNCTWVLIGKNLEIIHLFITDMEIEQDENCALDYLKVRVKNN